MHRRDFLRLLGATATLVPLNSAIALPLRIGGNAQEIVIDNGARTLTLLRGGRSVAQFRIAVGRIGMLWSGRTAVIRRVVNPWWQPPSIVRRDRPSLPDVVPPGPRNPLGTRALELARPEYAIHGTNDSSSIGRSVSYGCFRMHNRDVESLFDAVAVGTPVLIV